MKFHIENKQIEICAAKFRMEAVFIRAAKDRRLKKKAPRGDGNKQIYLFFREVLNRRLKKKAPRGDGNWLYLCK